MIDIPAKSVGLVVRRFFGDGHVVDGPQGAVFGGNPRIHLAISGIAWHEHTRNLKGVALKLLSSPGGLGAAPTCDHWSHLPAPRHYALPTELARTGSLGRVWRLPWRSIAIVSRRVV